MRLQNANRLLDDIKKLGMPEIFIYYHGFMVRITPEHHVVENGSLVFQGQNFVMRISLLGDTVLVEKTKPDNYIIECEKCYGVQQAKTGMGMTEVFWPKGRE
ncbi:MAG: hypothetical protein ACOY9Y_02250 [Bacillota bacterium]